MILSYYILKYPYILACYLIKLFRGKKQIVFYCDNELDYEICRNIDIPGIEYVARNRKIADKLKSHVTKVRTWPVFPDAVIMARHALHRFPCGSITRIGLRHGPYHFKKMIDPSRYNAFDLFLMTSAHEVEKARRCGITNSVDGGFPKLDSLLDGSIDSSTLQKLKNRLNLDPEKKTLLFSATWNNSGMSAVNLWYDKLDQLTDKYNILATVHPFTSRKIIEIIKSTENVHYIENVSLYPFMLLSDLLISDTSSIIAEYCPLDRPIICFNTGISKRTEPEVTGIINDLTHKIGDFNELAGRLDSIFDNPANLSDARKRALEIFFGDSIGNHCRKSTLLISGFLKKNGLL